VMSLVMVLMISWWWVSGSGWWDFRVILDVSCQISRGTWEWAGILWNPGSSSPCTHNCKICTGLICLFKLFYLMHDNVDPDFCT
jgi:hypothetical protein